jgi:hypothetical protein
MGCQCLKEFGMEVPEIVCIEKCTKGHGLTPFGIALVEGTSKSTVGKCFNEQRLTQFGMNTWT